MIFISWEINKAILYFPYPGGHKGLHDINFRRLPVSVTAHTVHADKRVNTSVCETNQCSINRFVSVLDCIHPFKVTFTFSQIVKLALSMWCHGSYMGN